MYVYVWCMFVVCIAYVRCMFVCMCTQKAYLFTLCMYGVWYVCCVCMVNVYVHTKGLSLHKRGSKKKSYIKIVWEADGSVCWSGACRCDMTVSTENATPKKSSKSRNSNSSVQIQIEPKSQYEFVLRDTEEFEYSIWWISGM